MGGAISKLTKLAGPLMGAMSPLGAITKTLETLGKVIPALGDLAKKTSPQQFSQLDEKLDKARGTGRLALDGANAFLQDPARGTQEFTPKTAIRP